jgi:hypothetical protein
MFIRSGRLKPSKIIFISIVFKFWILNINLAQFHAISQAQKKAPKSLHFKFMNFKFDLKLSKFQQFLKKRPPKTLQFQIFDF